MSKKASPRLNIHRFNTGNRLDRFKRKKEVVVSEETNGEEEKPVDKHSKEYIETLINSIYVNLQNEGEVPLLTSSSEVDLQLHAIVLLLLKNFVLSWYDRFTDDYSNEFLIELLYTSAHITRSLEEKLRKLDYKQLIMDDLFVVLDLHLSNYRKFKQFESTILLSKDDFDKIEPHPLTSHQSEYYTKLSGILLDETLPHEFNNSELTKKFLKSILTNMVFAICVEKLSEPYLLWEIIGKTCDSILVERPAVAKPKTSLNQWIRQLSHSIAYTTSTLASYKDQEDSTILSFHIFSFFNSLFNITYKLPILTMILTIFFKLSQSLNSKLNLILRNVINNFLYKYLVNEKFIVKILAISRQTIFPYDDKFQLLPRFIPTTDEELHQLMDETKFKVISVFEKVPALKLALYYKNDELMEQEITSFLESLAVKDINKHLVYMIIDLIFVRLFPEH